MIKARIKARIKLLNCSVLFYYIFWGKKYLLFIVLFSEFVFVKFFKAIFGVIWLHTIKFSDCSSTFNSCDLMTRISMNLIEYKLYAMFTSYLRLKLAFLMLWCEMAALHVSQTNTKSMVCIKIQIIGRHPVGCKPQLNLLEQYPHAHAQAVWVYLQGIHSSRAREMIAPHPEIWTGTSFETTN